MGEAIITRRGGGVALDGLIPIFFQNSQPSTDKAGAIWVKMASAPTGRILISYDVPSSPPWANGDFWLRTFTGTSDIANLEVDLTLKKTKVFATKGTNPWKVYDGKNVKLNMQYPNISLHRESGLWASKETYRWDGLTWVKFSDSYDYLYNLGVEIIPWVEGFTEFNGSLSKKIDHLYLYCQDVFTNSRPKRTWETEERINLTGVKTVKVEWENTGSPSGSGSNYSNIRVGATSPVKFGNHSTELKKGGSFSKITEGCDVTSLIGDFYISVGCESTKGGGSYVSELLVYKIWLEY